MVRHLIELRNHADPVHRDHCSHGPGPGVRAGHQINYQRNRGEGNMPFFTQHQLD
jgi:hypothetical protein